ncbi:MAG: phosphoribosylformylglycinamidine synthase [Peptoniphilaceae bacterium]|nr:phosphoribosylformylglycinamidine synthase [Peptoniphilaceae bacterium]MDY6019183.1 phosphoribosylformylglycinamidine synthase [Anaerococcus sp.]
MKILIVGSGGREFAIGTKIKNPSRKIYFAPGNGGTETLGENTGIAAEDINELLNFALKNEIDYTIVGPEVPLCKGIVDLFEENGLKIFGPKKEAARFEASKAYTKKFLKKYDIPTADFLQTSDKKEAIDFAEKLLDKDGKVVVKRDGLAAGKGVYIVDNKEDLVEKIEFAIDRDKLVVIEEFLDGFEASMLVLTDSKSMITLPTAKDHKKIYEKEMGPNTGGMGCFAPNIEADCFTERIKKEILGKILYGLKEENIDYRGVLFIGFMINDSGIYVLEFNVRFGDPETQVVLELIDNDLLDVLIRTSEARVDEICLKVNNKKALCLVLASEGYPSSYQKGKEISFKDTKSKIYHAGTKESGGKILTDGGRVLNIVYAGDNFDQVIEQVYEDAKKIDFEGKYYRKDIGPKVKRVYVRKKDAYDFESKELKKQIEDQLALKLDKFRIYKRYDLETSLENVEKLLYTVLAERPVDDLYYKDEAFRLQANMKHAIGVEYLPGQFDQRKQGLIDNASLLIDQEFDCKTSTIYEIEGASKKDLAKIEKFLVNPVDSQKVSLLGIPTTIKTERIKNLSNPIYQGFINYKKEDLENFIEENDLAMSYDDLVMVRDYFKSLNRDPNQTEIKILDTYWSDHCRHTTFNTNLDINIKPVTLLDKAIKETFDKYLAMREELGLKKPISLMDLSTLLTKYMRSKDIFEDIEVSSEINACSIYVKVRSEKNGEEKLEDYLLMFKNETHNHPTEIEPFGGASTCIGGAIRDPLSGRAFVYQAMRVSGAGNILEKVSSTLDGKLPQVKITREAANGYSSYANQIGLPAGLVEEVFHPGYTAKRMECGAVVAAAPVENVIRKEPKAGDVVILLGGRTGRDGIGGATGSSKSHKVDSIKTESAQVQKGNAPEERKIQRLFRIPEVSKMIKKCNDFGAGGVSVAIGELNDGIDIYLDKVLLKYQGLRPFEIAISESQERMAVVVEASYVDEFRKYCLEENLESTVVAYITDTNRLRMFYEDKIIADLSYDFINTNGAKRYARVSVTSEDLPKILTEKNDKANDLYEKVKELNITSQRNLIEKFDSTVGANTVINPLGGKKLVNPALAMVAKIPVMGKNSKTVSIMSYGFDPYLSEQSQYLGGYYAVIDSISKLVAMGSDLNQIRLSFQEFYEKMQDDKSWSKPIKSLLGAFEVTNFFKMPPIGGKDSMSGSFEDIAVPPTLISFAITTEDIENIKSNDLKGKGKLGLVKIDYRDDLRLDLNKLKEIYQFIIDQMREGNIISAIPVGKKGLLPSIYEQALGNTGFEISYDNLYNPMYGSFVVEYMEDRDLIENIGEFSDQIIVNSIKLDEKKLEEGYLHTLDKVFVPKEEILYKKLRPKVNKKRRLKSKKPTAKPLVTILAVAGTNCEWDTQRAFEKYGAEANIVLFRNQNANQIKDSIDTLANNIRKSQIFAIPGGFSLGDEPDGSAKFLANIIRNQKVKEAIYYLLEENDGLILGICNGFQALIKTGLLPYGKITNPKIDDPTLTFNTNRRHISTFVDTICISNNSPWTKGLDLDKIYKIPISHGEGRFIVNEEKLQELLDKDQVVSLYKVSPNGSCYNIEAISSEDGKILGRMGHVERIDKDLYKNIYDIEVLEIFKNAIEYFKED